MRKAITLALIIWAARAGAQEIKSVPITPTSPESGQEMFAAYCAACHGKDARGHGPAATALKKLPADLTQLSRKNGGKFPEVQVMRFISGEDELAAHGNRDMPVWGSLFRFAPPGDEANIRLRLSNLTDYIRSLQAK